MSLLHNRCLHLVLTLLLVVSPVHVSFASQSSGALVLLDGTPIRLRITRNLSSKEEQRGDTVDFEVLEEVRVRGVIVIEKGGVALGTITEAQPARRLGRGGKLDLVLDSVRLASGQRAALRAVKEKQGDGRVAGMTVGLVAAGLLFFPAAPFFLFMKGKDIEIPKGTELVGYVNGDMTIDLAIASGRPYSAAEPEAIPATPLPADSRRIPVGALPPAQPNLVAPVVRERSVGWTTREEGQVGYEWEAVVENRNDMVVKATVVIRLNDQQGNPIHEAADDVSLDPSMATALSGVGQIEDQLAVRGDHWTISVENFNAEGVSTQSEPLRPAATLGQQSVQPDPNEAYGATRQPDRETAELVVASVRDFGVQPSRLIVRCRVRRDGTVQAAIILETVPELLGEALNEIVESIVTHWRFLPVIRGGNAVESWQVVTLTSDLR